MPDPPHIEALTVPAAPFAVVRREGRSPRTPESRPFAHPYAAARREAAAVLSWTAGLGLAAAVGGGLLGWLLVAVGHNSERAQLAARGKQSVLWSLFGAGGIGVTSSLVLAFYNMAK